MKLEELIERVSKATGPDRELDWAIADAILPHGPCAPKLTSSLEAVLALVEREMPLVVVNINWNSVSAYVRIGSVEHKHKTPALALLLAFLRVKHAIASSAPRRR